MLAEEYVLQVEDLLVLYLKGCSANIYNFKQALLSYKRFTGHMTFTMCVNFTDIFQKERNHAAHRH